MRAPGRVLDPLAERIWELRRVGPGQWLLRGVAAAALLAALVVVFPAGPFLGFGPVLVSLAVLALLLVQSVVPDSDLGLAAPLLLVLALLPQEVSGVRALGVGLLLLAAHAAWAWAAMLPLHGTLSASAARLAGKSLLAVLGLIAVLAALVLVVGAVPGTGPWAIVLGALAVVGLLVLVLPRGR